MLFLLSIAVAPAQQSCPDRTETKTAFFGDTHVHTHYSLDAALMETSVGPAEAYQYAKGQAIQPFGPTGPTFQIDRPLDFVAVTDHAELLGEKQICSTKGERGYRSFNCHLFRNHPNTSFLLLNAPLSQYAVFDRVVRAPFCGWGGQRCREASIKPWNEIQQQAHAAYEPCELTTFVGYEWTASPGTINLHRNVIFKDEHVPQTPTSYIEAPKAHLLWEQLDQQCRSTDSCDVLTIPHNSNLSNGKMFLPYRPTKKTKQEEALVHYALNRAMNEPLVEIFQHKGDSECSPTAPDEFCQFEKIQYNNFISDRFGGLFTGEPKESDYIRDALGEGLQYHNGIGVNPFEYGIIASSDTHIATPGAVMEDSFQAHGGASVHHKDSKLGDDPSFNPGGLAVVWAEENTRESIFAAMERRETYGTSGPRIELRFFAADSFPDDICEQEDRIAQAYDAGVPMGGVVENRETLSFFVETSADPTSKALMRGQLIKGWVEDGVPKEQVIDIFDSSQGVEGFCGIVHDTEHDPTNDSFYYARIIELPSTRWTERKCQTASINCAADVPKGYEPCCNAAHPKVIHERAWSSPIWHYSAE